MPRYLLSQTLLFSRRLSSTCPLVLLIVVLLTKGLITKGRWAYLSHKREVRRKRGKLIENREQRNRWESRTTASSAPQERIVGSSAVKARLTWSTGILKTKGLYCASARVQIVRDYRNYVVWISFYDLGSHLQRWLSKLCCVQIMFSVNIIELGNKRGKP